MSVRIPAPPSTARVPTRASRVKGRPLGFQAFLLDLLDLLRGESVLLRYLLARCAYLQAAILRGDQGSKHFTTTLFGQLIGHRNLGSGVSLCFAHSAAPG
jgi:hypothetical protein